MRRIVFVIVLSAVLHYPSLGQMSVDSINFLKNKLSTTTQDAQRLNIALQLANGYRFSNVDSSFFYTDSALKIADKMNLPNSRAKILSLKGATLLESGRLPESLQCQFEALSISEKMKDTIIIGYVYNRIGNTYMELADYEKSLAYYFQSKELFEKKVDSGMYYNEISNIGNIYELLKKPDSALHYQQIAYDALVINNDRKLYTRPEILFRMGNAFKLKGDNIKALEFYKKGVAVSYIDNDIRDLSMNNLLLAKLYKEMNMPDSSRKYAYDAIQAGETVSFRKGIYEASLLMSELFKNKGAYDSAYKYLQRANVERDSLTGTKRFQELQHIILNQEQLQQQLQEQRDREDSRNSTIRFSIAIVIIILVVMYLLNNKQKQKKVNTTLWKQQQKISSQNQELEKTLTNLQSTQSQLIQSEKMASLGELTAGIAHEIQNPLNFVNNFSEVNKELVNELQQELKAGKIDDAIAISNDIKENEEKINHHGKRADAIVKGMLQHSRRSSGQKEPTDINALADEYLRLAYHGLRAKDKSFNASMVTHFDATIGKVNLVPQDIGRVILNLISNAFYVVDEKKKSGIENYEPTVSVSTKKIADKILISVKDNGNGIPAKVLDKIFQPFFTTKPTGQGTGLGLSLSYDIVKAHGGEITVSSKINEGSEFVISIPNNSN